MSQDAVLLFLSNFFLISNDSVRMMIHSFFRFIPNDSFHPFLNSGSKNVPQMKITQY